MNMLIFLLVVVGVIFYLSPLSPQPTNLLVDAFGANPALNGLILFVLFLGVVYHFNLTETVSRAVRWIEGFREGVDPSTRRMRNPPALISALSQLLAETNFRDKFTPESTRSMDPICVPRRIITAAIATDPNAIANAMKSPFRNVARMLIPPSSHLRKRSRPAGDSSCASRILTGRGASPNSRRRSLKTFNGWGSYGKRR